MTDERPVVDPMARTARTLGIITAVLTGLVAFNTLVISCASDRDARERAALERLEGDERFWTEAMKDLSNLVAKKPSAGLTDPNWDAQCGMLAERTVRLVADDLERTSDDERSRSISEIDEEFPRAFEVRKRVRALRDFFQARMQDPVLIGSCAGNFAKKLDRAEEANRISKTSRISWPEIAAEIGYTMSPDTLDAIEANRPSISLTPSSATRWDVDVFWCARDDAVAQSANFTRAVAEGLALAKLAQAEDRIGNDRLGQVRVRTLSQSAQAVRGPLVYFKSGNRFLYDRRNRNEQRLVNDLIARLNSARIESAGGISATGPILAQDQGRPSPWYLSLFICGAMDQLAAGAPANDVQAPDLGTAKAN